MALNIETILSRGDFQIPVFANFILNKYKDLKEVDPEAAHKIETRVFTPSFLLSILDNGHKLIQSQMFSQVPHNFFVPIMDQLMERLKNGSLTVRESIITPIFKTNAPDLFLTMIKKKVEQEIAREPVSFNTFNWYNHFKDLPSDLRNEYFDRTYSLFLKARESLEESSNFQAILFHQTWAALALDRPEAVILAKQYLEEGILTYNNEDDYSYRDVCLNFARTLTLERFKGSHYELDLFFELRNGELKTFPTLSDHLYEEDWSCSRLFDIYTSLIRSKDLNAPSVLPELLNSINEPLLTTIITTLVQDKALMHLLESFRLHTGITAVFLSIIWQFHRKKEINSALFSNANTGELLDFITINSTNLPCMDEIKISLSAIPPHEMASLLCTAMDKKRNNLEQTGYGHYAIANIVELMAHFKHPSFASKLVDLLLSDSELDDGSLIEKTILALSGFGDVAIESLESKQQDVLKYHELELLDVIQKIGTERAEDFLMKHFDYFMKSSKPDTLETCLLLVSEKALERLKHKVGKNQRSIDELYVIVKTFMGEANDETQRLLDLIPVPGDSMDAAMDMLKSNTAQPFLNLALECTHCGDVSTYECRDIIISPSGPPYVADELTCISCNKICEFSVETSGRMAVTLEMLRLSALKEKNKSQENPFTGAVRFLQTAIMGKEMSLTDGITLYKEKISKKPKNPDNYVGLGNIYKYLRQYTLAEEQYKKAIEHGPFYIEGYLELAEIAKAKEDYHTALDWLERGRPYLKRPLICKNIDMTAEEIMKSYHLLHDQMLYFTGSPIPSIAPSEYQVAGKRLNKIGRNEKCPCGSGKKYKKCCMIKK